MAQRNSCKKSKNSIQGAPGALAVCQASVISTSPPDACQAVHTQAEPRADLAIHLGGATNQIKRRSPMIVEPLRTSTVAPAINVALPVGRLSDLITAFEAAERQLGVACEADDKYPHRREAPKVFGGITAASTFVIDGRPDVHIPASEWFYRSREDIELDYAQRRLNAKTVEEFDAIEQRFNELRAECDRQLKAIERAVPRGRRQAERKLNAAHRAVSAAERRILNYKPASLDEAVTLLEYTSGGKRRSCFSTDEDDLHTIMLNVADAIRRAI
jgi:hypothetical protein